MAKIPSSTITRKIDLTTELVVCSPSDSALPCTCRPSTHATTPMTSAMNGALICPTSTVLIVTPPRPRPPRKPGNQAAAVKCRHRSEKSKRRNRDHQRDDARENEHLYRIETHRAQCVDFFAHTHRTEFRG